MVRYGAVAVAVAVGVTPAHVWYGYWYGMVWYGVVVVCEGAWYGMVWYGMVWYGMVWYGMVWYGPCTTQPWRTCNTLRTVKASTSMAACVGRDWNSTNSSVARSHLYTVELTSLVTPL